MTVLRSDNEVEVHHSTCNTFRIRQEVGCLNTTFYVPSVYPPAGNTVKQKIICLQTDLAALLSEGRLRTGLSLLNASAGGEGVPGSVPGGAGGALYKLTAVVVHVGGPRSGHFATYRRGNGFETKR